MWIGRRRWSRSRAGSAAPAAPSGAVGGRAAVPAAAPSGAAAPSAAGAVADASSGGGILAALAPGPLRAHPPLRTRVLGPGGPAPGATVGHVPASLFLRQRRAFSKSIPSSGKSALSRWSFGRSGRARGPRGAHKTVQSRTEGTDPLLGNTTPRLERSDNAGAPGDGRTPRQGPPLPPRLARLPQGSAIPGSAAAAARERAARAVGARPQAAVEEVIMAVADNNQTNEDFAAFPEIIELNVGGQVYITRHPTLVSIQGSLLWEMFSQKNPLALSQDNKGRFFVDRDGFLFRYVLDYMRDHQLVLPDHFPERRRLKREAEYFKLPELVKILTPETRNNDSFMSYDATVNDLEEQYPNQASSSSAIAAVPDDSPGTTKVSAVGTRKPGYITLGYRGSYTLGRESQTDAKFRRVARIMVCSKISLAKEVFGETLNESRDPDRPPERYTSRYYLKFNNLEQAFDKLDNAGFHLVTSNSTGTCSCTHDQFEDKIWTSYTEYIFYRKPSVDEEPSAPSSSPDSQQKQVSRESHQEVPKSSNIWEPKLRQKGKPSLESLPGALKSTASSPEQHREVASTVHQASQEQVSSKPVENQAARRTEPELSVPFVWPDQDMCPSRPESLRYYQPLKHFGKVKQSGQRWNNETCSVLGMTTKDISDKHRKTHEERKFMEKELEKCIEDFRKIKIPCTFPNKKRQWQSELLQKYQL